STEFRCFDGASLPTAAALEYEHPALALPTSLQDWVHSVRYHYGFQHDFETGPAFEQEGMLEQFPRLFKVSAASRRQLAGGAPVTTEPAVVRSWVFEYASPAGMNQDAWLVSVYEPDAVDRAIVAFRRLQPGIAEFGASWLALALNYGGFTTTFNSGVMPALRAEASVRWTPDPVPGTTPGYFQTMLPGGRPAYIRTAAPLELPNYDSQVGTLALTGDQGQGRFYRFRRFVAGADVDDAPRPHRSAFHVPYTWRSYGNPPFTPEPQPLEDFTQPRWITIIDEFDSAQAMTDGAGLQGAPPSYLTAPGMVGRRVLHVGASGVVLRDHYWKFKNGELIDSGGAGLGAENVYWPAEAFLAAEGMTLPPVPPREPGPIPGLTLPPDDPLAHLRNELLLVEHRSVGWSVAENNLAGLTQGFVRFFEYEALTYDTDPANPGDPIGQSNWLTDTGARVELRAEGVKEGQAYTVNAAGELEENDNGKPRLYTRDILRPGDPSDPGGLPSAWQQPDDPERWEYLCEVRYLVPAEDAARITAPPPPGDPPPLTGGPRPEPTVALSYQLTKRRADDPNDPRPAFERATESTLAIGPARQQRPGGSWYFPVDRQVFDTEGKLLRQMSGLVRNPIYPGGGNDGLEALSHTVHIYNSEGRTRHTLADVAVGANGELPSAYTLNHFQARERPAEAQVQESELTPAPPCPPGWTISPLVPPRNYVTT
ncbi:MAG TPA: hypothetical protein VD963_01465, partial [Phycisphaerales bacterium]|nr:hypothetical protein [Phycisphaerales bacterium]